MGANAEPIGQQDQQAPMFRGFNAVTIDAKGRLAVPARHRDLLVTRGVGSLVMTISPWDSCIWLYPLPDWDEMLMIFPRLCSIMILPTA